MRVQEITVHRIKSESTIVQKPAFLEKNAWKKECKN